MCVLRQYFLPLLRQNGKNDSTLGCSERQAITSQLVCTLGTGPPNKMFEGFDLLALSLPLPRSKFSGSLRCLCCCAQPPVCAVNAMASSQGLPLFSGNSHPSQSATHASEFFRRFNMHALQSCSVLTWASPTFCKGLFLVPCNSVFVLVLPDFAFRCVRPVHTHGWRGTFAWRCRLSSHHSDVASRIRGATVAVSPKMQQRVPRWCCRPRLACPRSRWRCLSLRPLTRVASAHWWSAADSRVTHCNVHDSAYISVTSETAKSSPVKRMQSCD